jgi:hypothetical protein
VDCGRGAADGAPPAVVGFAATVGAPPAPLGLAAVVVAAAFPVVAGIVVGFETEDQLPFSYVCQLPLASFL